MPAAPTIRPSSQATGDGADQQTYAFELTWTAPNGQKYDGRFVHRCPTVGESVAIEIALAERMKGAVTAESARDMAMMLEHLRITLKERPPWAASVDDIPHAALLNAVAEEVAAHLGRFHGQELNPG